MRRLEANWIGVGALAGRIERAKTRVVKSVEVEAVDCANLFNASIHLLQSTFKLEKCLHTR